MGQMKVIDAIKLLNTEIKLRNPNQDRINIYAEAMSAGAVFPPIVLGTWPKSDKYGETGIVDGLHRLAAAQVAKIPSVAVQEIKFPSLQDMLAYMYTANMSHGLAPTEGQRNERIRLLKKIDPALTLEKIAEQFKLGKSSVHRILGNDQGEGKSGVKTGTKRSAAHKDLKPLKPKAFFATLERLANTMSKKNPAAEILAYAAPEGEEGVEIDQEKVTLLKAVRDYCSAMIQELK